MSEVISIAVPDPLFDRLSRQAKASSRPVEDVVVSALSESIPEPPAHLPDEIRRQLSALETLSDNDLRTVASSVLNDKIEVKGYQPGDVGDLLMLKKAYARVVLRWRGCDIQSIDRTNR